MAILGLKIMRGSGMVCGVMAIYLHKREMINTPLVGTLNQNNFLLESSFAGTARIRL